MTNSFSPVGTMFPQQACGCPTETFRFPFRCAAHAGPRILLPNDKRGEAWYAANTCPACGKVNPAGLFCAPYSGMTVPGCPLGPTCADHGQAHFRLKTACPMEPLAPRGRIPSAIMHEAERLAGAYHHAGADLLPGGPAEARRILQALARASARPGQRAKPVKAGQPEAFVMLCAAMAEEGRRGERSLPKPAAGAAREA